MSILASKLGRAVYTMLIQERAFDMHRFVARSAQEGADVGDPAAQLGPSLQDQGPIQNERPARVLEICDQSVRRLHGTSLASGRFDWRPTSPPHIREAPKGASPKSSVPFSSPGELDEMSQADLEWTSEGTDGFLGHGVARPLRGRFPIGVWCRLERAWSREAKRGRRRGEVTRRSPTPCQLEASRNVLTY